MQDKTRSEFVQEFGEKMALLSKEEKEISSKIVQYSNANQSIPKELKERQSEIRIEATSWIKRFDNINVLYPLKEQRNNDQLNFIPSPDERNSAQKEIKIKLDELALKYYEKMKSEAPLERCEAIAEYQLKSFKLNSKSPFTKHSLMVIDDLEIVLGQLQIILIVTGQVSIEKQLYAIKEIRSIVLRSDTKAKQLLEMEELGLHESNSKSIVLAMKQQISKEVYSNPDALMFTPLITDPLFVAKTHIPMYGRILELLDREEEMILIELRNGKSLDYSPLNDKKDNPQPTTSATVEEGKEVEIIIKDEVNGTPCIEFNKLFGADIARKNEVWQYMKLLGMIDNEGKCLHPEKTATIRAFVVVMRKNFKLPFAKSPDELIKIFGLKLSISDILRVRPATEIELKEQEIVSLINAFETKNLPFT